MYSYIRLGLKGTYFGDEIGEFGQNSPKLVLAKNNSSQLLKIRQIRTDLACHSPKLVSAKIKYFQDFLLLAKINSRQKKALNVSREFTVFLSTRAILSIFQIHQTRE